MSEQPKANHGAKLNVRYDLIVPEFVEAMARIMHRGAKYGEENWKYGDDDFVRARTNHLEKHLNRYKQGLPPDVDMDNGELEDDLAAVAVNAMFLWWYQRRGVWPFAERSSGHSAQLLLPIHTEEPVPDEDSPASDKEDDKSDKSFLGKASNFLDLLK